MASALFLHGNTLCNAESNLKRPAQMAQFFPRWVEGINFLTVLSRVKKKSIRGSRGVEELSRGHRREEDERTVFSHDLALPKTGGD